ncbi:MAG: metallophosphoesterase [Deltaproteobacteria bacterium]|nr:metallophosphoesterase [Deltaproteobacteria bacterium]
MKKYFNKYISYAVILILIFSVTIKLYSIFTFPEVNDWNYHEIKKIDKTNDTYSFAVFGDNKNSITTFDELINKLNHDDIIFAIDIGDLVEDGEKEKFRFFINQIKKADKPFLTAIGNHELREDGRANYYPMFGRFYYSFKVGESYFIILDDANEERLDLWQLDWLENELQKAQSYKYRFVFMHVPLYDPRQGENEEGHSLKDLTFAGQLNDIFDKYHVSMLFCSHIHGYYKGYWKNTPFTITGGAGGELAGTDPSHYFYHYMKVNISQEGIKYEVKKLKSPDFELIDRLIHDAWIFIYAFIVVHFIDIIIITGCMYLLILLFLSRRKLI